MEPTCGHPSYNEYLESILERFWSLGYGGSDVAVQMESPPSTIKALPAAGVSEAIDWARRRLNSAETGSLSFLFLIGGPGGGKSAAAEEIVKGFTILSRESPLAQRTYDYMAPVGKVRVINDATIPTESTGEGDLVGDIDTAIAEGVNLIACANRGVITENLGRGVVTESTPGRRILTAVATAQDARGKHVQAQESDWHNGGEWSFLRSKDVVYGSREVRLIVVFLDECSLLEERPDVDLSIDSSIKVQRYQIPHFVPGLDRTDTPAGDLFRKLTSGADNLANSVNPLSENLKNLDGRAPLNGLLSIIRAAEIISDRRLTYRDLWATAVRSIAGSHPGFSTPEGTIDSINRTITRAQDRKTPYWQRWEDVYQLTRLRYFMAIFERPATGLDDGASHDVLSTLFGSADPATNVDTEFEWESGVRDSSESTSWADELYNAFSVLEEEDSPLDYLQRNAPKAVQQVIGPFEELLDEVFLAVLREGTDREKVIATRWYGLYLLRLKAVALGIPAFCSAIQLWTRAWNEASRGRLLKDLTNGLRTLINPPKDPRDLHSYVPTFGSRAEAVVGRVQEAQVLTELSDLAFKGDVEGERIWIRINWDGSRIGRIRLDVELIRQIQTASDSHRGHTGVSGITERSALLQPRLERVRAAQLGGAREATYVFTRSDQSILIGTKGLRK